MACESWMSRENNALFFILKPLRRDVKILTVYVDCFMSRKNGDIIAHGQFQRIN